MVVYTLQKHPIRLGLITLCLLFTTSSVFADNVIRWAGCGITKKAFMAELAHAYEAKTNVKVILEGGGATRGIRDTVSLRIDLGR